MCAVTLAAAALSPVWGQSAATTDKAQERSQQQSDDVYRWIKYFADQPKKVVPNKARPKAETPQLAKNPEAKTPVEPIQVAPATAPATDTATATDIAQTPSTPQAVSADAPQQPASQAVAAAPPSEPEPEVVEEVVEPLKPVHVVNPGIPREL
ncbi:MAG: hypothetical protein ABIZ09_01485 [Rhodoferax sp.]